MEDTEVEKIRYERLKLVSKKALELSIKKSLSIEQIRSCYPTIASTEEGEKALEIARSQIVKFWHKTSMEEFDLIFKERDIENKLDELDQIIYDAKKRKETGEELPVAFDTLTPDQVMEASLVETKKSTLERLQMIYSLLCTDNVHTYEDLRKDTEESQDISNELQGLLKSLTSNFEGQGGKILQEKIDNLLASKADLD